MLLISHPQIAQSQVLQALPLRLDSIPNIFGWIVATINNQLIPLVIGLALLAFLWGMFMLITASDDEGKRKEAINIITYGIVGLFVMISVWGFVNILIGTFGFDFVMPGLPRNQ